MRWRCWPVFSMAATARVSPAELVRGQQIATTGRCGLRPVRSAGKLVDAGWHAGQGHDIAALEKALRAQIALLRDQPVTVAELERVKAQVLADHVYQEDSVFYQAMRIGTLESVGLGWQRLDEYLPRVQAVTAEQVQKVARKYLLDDRLTIAVLEPQPMDAGARARAAAAAQGVSHGH